MFYCDIIKDRLYCDDPDSDGYGNPGRQDDGLGPALAECIQALQWTGVTGDADYQLNIENGAAVVQRETGGGAKEILEFALPGVVGATKGLNEPRYPKFPDIMKAKKKEVKQTDLAQLGIDAAAPETELLQLEAVPPRTAAKMMPGSIGEQVSELVRILKDEEKVLDI